MSIWHVFLLYVFLSLEMNSCTGQEHEAYWPRQGQSFLEYASDTEVKEDIKLIREILPDTTEQNQQQSEKSRFLEDIVNTEYATLISNLASENQRSFVNKIDAIRRALVSTFQRASGIVDTSYADGIISMIKKDVDQKRRLSYGQFKRTYM